MQASGENSILRLPVILEQGRLHNALGDTDMGIFFATQVRGHGAQQCTHTHTATAGSWQPCL